MSQKGLDPLIGVVALTLRLSNYHTPRNHYMQSFYSGAHYFSTVPDVVMPVATCFLSILAVYSEERST